MKKKKNIVFNFYSVLFFIFILAVWETVSRTGLVPEYILPAPTKIVLSVFINFRLYWFDLLITIIETMSGFLIAIVLGFITAILMDASRIINKILYPLLITSQTIPIITLAPLFIIWFGYGLLPKIIIVILICFFPITISLLSGFANADLEQINLLKSMKARKFHIYKYIKLPYSLPGFFSGLKIAATYSIMGATIGEWVGGKDGIGVFMLRAKHSFATDKVFGAILIITVLSILFIRLINAIEKKSMPWKKFEKGEVLEE
ncbi:MAG TPA: ABC transporter permease [Actinobacteria bacterium]|nr:ABC transporter permease [Actinomycetota bacterium]